jgi:tRNA G18 (ribose-2'-O)-methylase SpoU
MLLTPITTLADPRIAEYANLRDAELAQRLDPLDAAAHRGLFIAEGELVVRRLLGSRFRTRSVLLAPSRLAPLRPDLDRLSPQTPVYVAEQPLFNAIVGFNMHRGLLAIGERPPPLPLTSFLTLPGPLIVLEDLVNHDNLGGIFRNAAALGGPGCAVLLSPRCADPLYRKSLRVSMGHVLTVPFTRSGAWPDDLDALREAGCTVLALTPTGAEGAEATDLATAAAGLGGNRVALVLGSEGAGLAEATLKRADRAVRIPMRPPPGGGPPIDSLNVAMAAGIALYHLGRS